MKRLWTAALALVLALSAWPLLATGKAEGPAAGPAQPYSFRIFAYFRQQQMSDADKAIFEAVEKANNVKIVWETPPSSSYQERLQLMLAGGNYPEVVYFESTGDRVFLDAVKNGAVIPVTKYLKYMPNFTKYSYKESWDYFKVLGDADIYALPRTSIARADGYYVRKDWLSKLGISVPEGGPIGYNEFNDLLRRFTKDDPDGNGKPDTYGFGPSTDSLGNMGPILTSTFGMVGWQKYEGDDYPYMNLQFSRKNPGYKKALAHTAQLWKDGLVDPDWPVVKGEQAIVRFKQGVTGMQGAFAGWTYQYIQDMQKINPKVALTYITAVKDPEGKQVAAGAFGTGTWGMWAVTNSVKEKDAEKLFSTIDWFLGDQGWLVSKYGPEGLMWTAKDGAKAPTDKYSTDVWIRNMFRRNNDPEFFIPLNIPPDMQPTIKGWLAACIAQARFSLDMGFRPAAVNDPKYIDYQKTMNQAISKIVTGAQPVDSWDAVLDGWYKNGGEDYMKQMNAFIVKNQK